MKEDFRQRLIQTLLIERQRAVESLLEAQREPDSEEAADLAGVVLKSGGKMEALLWVLRELEPDREKFLNLLSVLGWREDDDEVAAVEQTDVDLETYAQFTGEMAALAVRIRESEDALAASTSAS